MEAANGGDKAENNVDEYMANRSKILSGAASAVKRAETALKTAGKQVPAQVDRKQAMAKISLSAFCLHID